MDGGRDRLDQAERLGLALRRVALGLKRPARAVPARTFSLERRAGGVARPLGLAEPAPQTLEFALDLIAFALARRLERVVLVDIEFVKLIELGVELDPGIRKGSRFGEPLVPRKHAVVVPLRREFAAERGDGDHRLQRATDPRHGDRCDSMGRGVVLGLQPHPQHSVAMRTRDPDRLAAHDWLRATIKPVGDVPPRRQPAVRFSTLCAGSDKSFCLRARMATRDDVEMLPPVTTGMQATLLGC